MSHTLGGERKRLTDFGAETGTTSSSSQHTTLQLSYLWCSFSFTVTSVSHPGKLAPFYQLHMIMTNHISQGLFHCNSCIIRSFNPLLPITHLLRIRSIPSRQTIRRLGKGHQDLDPGQVLLGARTARICPILDPWPTLTHHPPLHHLLHPQLDRKIGLLRTRLLH